MGIDNPVHLLFIAVVALLVLGPRRLPELARSLGRGIRELREAMEDGGARHEQVMHVPEPGSDTAGQVDPPGHVRSADAPDRRPL